MRASLGLDASVDIGDFNHFDETRLENPLAQRVILGVTAFHNAAIKLHSFIGGAASATLDSPGVRAALSQAVYSAFANQLLNGTFDLASVDDLRDVMRRAFTNFNAIASELDLNLSVDPLPTESMIDGLAQILAAGTIKLRHLAEQATTGHELVTVINQAKKVTQSIEAPDLALLGRGELSMAEALVRYVPTDQAALDAIRQTLLPPHMTHVPDFTLFEDGSLSDVELKVFDFETTFGEITLSVTSTNPELLPSDKILITAGTTGEDRLLSITPTADRSGVAVVELTVHDADGFHLSQEFTVTVLEVNDTPSFTMPRHELLVENNRPVDIPWISNISSGSEQEDSSSQFLELELLVSDADQGLFLKQPAIDLGTGFLSFTPNPAATGVAEVTVTLRDGGDTPPGGVNDFSQTFRIVLVPALEAVEVFIFDVLPDPTDEPVESIAISFSQPVTGFELDDLQLRRNGSNNLLDLGTATLQSDDGIHWTLANLTSMTELGGQYVLTLDADQAGINGLTGTPLVNDAVEIWRNANPGDDEFQRMDINRSGEVTPLDVLLVINALNLGNSSSSLFDLDVNDDGIVSPIDVLLVINYLGQMQFEPRAEAVEVFIFDVLPDPTVEPVESIAISFSQPVTGFGLDDLQLRRNGGDNLLDLGTATLQSDDGIHWTLANLTSMTEIGGQYILTLDADQAGIKGLTGTPLVDDAVETWLNTHADAGWFQRMDINRSGEVTPLDVLLVIHALNSGGSSSSPFDLDVNADGIVSPIDVLLIISHLNQGQFGLRAEGENSVAPAAGAPAESSEIVASFSEVIYPAMQTVSPDATSISMIGDGSLEGYAGTSKTTDSMTKATVDSTRARCLGSVACSYPRPKNGLTTRNRRSLIWRSTRSHLTWPSNLVRCIVDDEG